MAMPPYRVAVHVNLTMPFDDQPLESAMIALPSSIEKRSQPGRIEPFARRR
jgi:hypothetical protein